MSSGTSSVRAADRKSGTLSDAVPGRDAMVGSGGDRRPRRVAARPDPADWGADELMTLAEAAAVFWPDGPLNVSSLRTAERDGQLAVVTIAGKLFTTRTAVVEMTSALTLDRMPRSRPTDARRFRDQLLARRRDE